MIYLICAVINCLVKRSFSLMCTLTLSPLVVTWCSTILAVSRITVCYLPCYFWVIPTHTTDLSVTILQVKMDLVSISVLAAVLWCLVTPVLVWVYVWTEVGYHENLWMSLWGRTALAWSVSSFKDKITCITVRGRSRGSIAGGTTLQKINAILVVIQ